MIHSKMNYDENKFKKALSQSYKNYLDYGPRSTEKLKPLHKFVATRVKNIFGKDYKLHFIGDDTKELKVEGKYYQKDIDITVTKDNKPVICIGIKFVTSNYK